MLALKRAYDGFDAVYKDLLRQFPPQELKSEVVLRALIARGDYHLWYAEDDGRRIGYLIVYCDRKTGLLWLDYFAVFAPFHNRGYGAKLLALLPTRYPRARGCFLEVQPPAPHVPNSIRRAQFYRRCGARRLYLDYYYPCAEGLFPMHLFFIAFDDTARAQLSGDTLFGVIRRVFLILHPERKCVPKILQRLRRTLRLRERERLRRKREAARRTPR